MEKIEDPFKYTFSQNENSSIDLVELYKYIIGPSSSKDEEFYIEKAELTRKVYLTLTGL